jgi:hypothetical protein
MGRRRFKYRAALTLAVAITLAASVPSYAAPPTLTFSGGTTKAQLVAAYNLALRNLLDINTVRYDPATYNSTGLLTTNPQLFIVAGADYPDPWTRDASINSMAAASLLEPVVAENTLFSVCTGKASDNTLILVDGGDDQWWDQSIWVISAWNHYCVTGDKTFLTNAEQVARNSIAWSETNHFDATRGLFQGPAHFNDGIAGYPAPPATAPETSSAATDYSGTLTANTLSVNVLSYQAYLSLALMADELARGGNEASDARTKATALAAEINNWLWQPGLGRYGYLVHGDDSMTGQVDLSQEGTGTAMAILYGVASPAQVASILKNIAIAPQGIVDVYPHFARYSDEKPGRHNMSVWPMVEGVWAHATASVGADWLFRPEVEHLANNATNPNDPDHVQFREIYEFQSGLENGGWQTGSDWGSAQDQTWSATAFLRMMYSGLFGMSFEPAGIQFAPVLPYGWGVAELSGLSYRGATLDIKLTGAGTKIASFAIDGVASTSPLFVASMTGSHTIEIAMTAALENVATTATVTVSGTASGFAVAGLTDGEVNGAPVDQPAEWAAPATPATGAWVRMDWAQPTTIRKVRIFDRVNTSDQVTGGHLDMSDGSTMVVTALQNDGETPWDVDFPDRTVTWVRFTIDSVSSTTTEPGLAEFEVYGLVPSAVAGGDGGGAVSEVADSGSAMEGDGGGNDAASGIDAAPEGGGAVGTARTASGSCACTVPGSHLAPPGAAEGPGSLLGIAYLAWRGRRRGPARAGESVTRACALASRNRRSKMSRP